MRRIFPVLVCGALALTACGSDSASGSESGTPDADAPGVTLGIDYPAKPTVEVPKEVPTELVVTVLEEGTGPEAAAGDTVVVDYVGVRTVDGVEFDNSYDRFSPYPVTLGAGMVIPGWEDGLVGARTGARIQLDIPSELAYGEESRGDIIRANEPLTFVVEIRTVIPAPDLADEPAELPVAPSVGATELSFEDVTVGDGEPLEIGQNALLRFVLFRGDNGVRLESNWGDEVLTFPMDETRFPVFFEGLQGMKVGGRRAIVIPPIYPDWNFGPDGQPTNGLPANTDAIIVVDLVGAY